MAMEQRQKRVRQEQLWKTRLNCPFLPVTPFYERLNRLLDQACFDDFV
jgi:hypothetical protein